MSNTVTASIGGGRYTVISERLMTSGLSFLIDTARVDLPWVYDIMGRLKPPSVGMLSGEGVDVIEHAQQIYERNNGETEVFVQFWSPDNRAWTKETPQYVVDGLKQSAQRAPHIIFNLLREPLAKDTAERRQLSKWAADVCRIARDASINVAVPGFPTGYVDSKETEDGVWDDLLNGVIDYDQWLAGNDYAYCVIPTGTGAIPPDFLLNPAKMQRDLWPDPTKTYPPNTLRRMDILHNHAVGKLEKKTGPKMVLPEWGWDKIDQFSAIDDILRQFPGIAEHSNGNTFPGFRGPFTFRKVWKWYWPEWSFHDAVIEQVRWWDDYLNAAMLQGYNYRAGWHLYMLSNGSEWDWPFGFNFAGDRELVELLIAYALSRRDVQPKPEQPDEEPPVVVEPDEPEKIDVLPYLRGDGRQYGFSSGERMRAEVDEQRAGVWYQVKNHQFEEFFYDDQWIYRGIDTSPGNDQVYILYEDNPREKHGYGSRWMPRLVTIGDRFKRVAWVEFRRKSTRELVPLKTYRDETELRVERLHDTYTFPSNIELNNVLELRALQSDGTPFEAYFYARGYGLVMWKNLLIGLTYHITHKQIDAPQLEREKLVWWEAMDKPLPMVSEPEPEQPAPDEPEPDVPTTPRPVLDEATRQKITQSLDDLEAAFANFIGVCRAVIAN